MDGLSGAGHAIIHALEVSSLFFYKALWSILFGVAVTAAIDVFVDKDKMARLLGGRDAKTTGVAAAAGAVSSSCTFGAVTIGQALFKKGASVESTFAFALASTNIVFELAVLIWVLLGPVFFVGEAVAGVMMVVLMYGIVRLTLPVQLFEESRRTLQQREGDAQEAFTPQSPTCGHGEPLLFVKEYQGTLYRFCSEQCLHSFERQIAGRGPWQAQLKTLGGWYRIAIRYIHTLARIYKSVFFGFLISGFIVTFVPTWLWKQVFIRNTSFLGVLENAVVGVIAGIFSFIASIGIVPFAAALFLGGASFVGVIGCMVADQITVPVLNVWAKFFGRRATIYIFVVFFTTMVVSSVATHYLFAAFGWLPTKAHAGRLAATGIQLNYTLLLNVAFLALTGTLWVVRRIGDAKGVREVRDPVCGMVFPQREAVAVRTIDGKTHYFCSQECAEAYSVI